MRGLRPHNGRDRGVGAEALGDRRLERVDAVHSSATEERSGRA